MNSVRKLLLVSIIAIGLTLTYASPTVIVFSSERFQPRYFHEATIELEDGLVIETRELVYGELAHPAWINGSRTTLDNILEMVSPSVYEDEEGVLHLNFRSYSTSIGDDWDFTFTHMLHDIQATNENIKFNLTKTLDGKIIFREGESLLHRFTGYGNHYYTWDIYDLDDQPIPSKLWFE